MWHPKPHAEAPAFQDKTLPETTEAMEEKEETEETENKLSSSPAEGKARPAEMTVAAAATDTSAHAAAPFENPVPAGGQPESTEDYRAKLLSSVTGVDEQFRTLQSSMRELVSLVKYGNDGLKNLCKLWSEIAPVEDPVLQIAAGKLEHILQRDFGLDPIAPEKGTDFLPACHALLRDPVGGLASDVAILRCVCKGWQYNGEIFVKAVVEIAPAETEETHNESY